ncbi:hypothetical protein HanPI659440_Chr12g0458821 [Helianthus annuus]|nr:hypothetical protein HanPI659440_Chr12g0458821 [Helianthus annuus]
MNLLMSCSSTAAQSDRFQSLKSLKQKLGVKRHFRSEVWPVLRFSSKGLFSASGPKV